MIKLRNEVNYMKIFIRKLSAVGTRGINPKDHKTHLSFKQSANPTYILKSTLICTIL
jgi:hypothetical protein